MKTPMVTDELILALQKDMLSGILPLNQQVIADDQVPKLRVIVHKNAPSKYLYNGRDIPAVSVVEARKLAIYHRIVDEVFDKGSA